MKSLTNKQKKDQRKDSKKTVPRTPPPTRDQAQCCAKISKNIAGCHD